MSLERGSGAPERASELSTGERITGWIILAGMIGLSLLALLLGLIVFPLVLVAFPMTLSALAVVILIGWTRHRRRSKARAARTNVT